jgi:hypothetical protein
MTEILTIGDFLHDLNIPGLKKQADALSVFKQAIDDMFLMGKIPNFEDVCYRQIVADGLEYYYTEFRRNIQDKYAPEFRNRLQGTLTFLFIFPLNPKTYIITLTPMILIFSYRRKMARNSN